MWDDSMRLVCCVWYTGAQQCGVSLWLNVRRRRCRLSVVWWGQEDVNEWDNSYAFDFKDRITSARFTQSAQYTYESNRPIVDVKCRSCSAAINRFFSFIVSVSVIQFQWLLLVCMCVRARWTRSNCVIPFLLSSSVDVVVKDKFWFCTDFVGIWMCCTQQHTAGVSFAVHNDREEHNTNT